MQQKSAVHRRCSHLCLTSWCIQSLAVKYCESSPQPTRLILSWPRPYTFIQCQRMCHTIRVNTGPTHNSLLLLSLLHAKCSNQSYYVFTTWLFKLAKSPINMTKLPPRCKAFCVLQYFLRASPAIVPQKWPMAHLALQADSLTGCNSDNPIPKIWKSQGKI